MVAHLGLITGGRPMMVPTVYGFDADTLYLHGSVASQSVDSAGTPMCVTITVTDGLVLARSVGHRPGRKLARLRCLTEQVAPCAWGYARRLSRKEPAAARLLALPPAEAPVKGRHRPARRRPRPRRGAGPVGPARGDHRWTP